MITLILVACMICLYKIIMRIKDRFAMSSEFGSLLYHESNMQQLTSATSNPAAYSTAPEEGAPVVLASVKRRRPYREPGNTRKLCVFAVDPKLNSCVHSTPL